MKESIIKELLEKISFSNTGNKKSQHEINDDDVDDEDAISIHAPDEDLYTDGTQLSQKDGTGPPVFSCSIPGGLLSVADDNCDNLSDYL